MPRKSSTRRVSSSSPAIAWRKIALSNGSGPVNGSCDFTFALYNGATGGADPTWSSCAGDVGATDITCVMSITSLKTSGNIRYSLRVPEYTGDPALASLLTATFYRSPSATTCDPVATGWSGTGSGEVAIGSVPGFGDPAPGAQAGDRELEPGQVDWICMVVHLGAGPRPFGTALSAVLRVVSDDEGY